jgi:hypothetical protein
VVWEAQAEAVVGVEVDGSASVWAARARSCGGASPRGSDVILGSSLMDHLVGPRQQRWRDRAAKGLRSLHC